MGVTIKLRKSKTNLTPTALASAQPRKPTVYLRSTRLIDGHFKPIHTIDLASFDKIANRLEKAITNLNLSRTDATSDLLNYQTEKISSHLRDLKGPEVTKTKSSINWILSAWKWIAGTPDATDWDELL